MDYNLINNGRAQFLRLVIEPAKSQHAFIVQALWLPRGGYLKVCAIFKIVRQLSFMVCILSYLVEIYYNQNLNIAPGLGYDPHNDWTITCVI